jgi:hypothetical protein
MNRWQFGVDKNKGPCLLLGGLRSKVFLDHEFDKFLS